MYLIKMKLLLDLQVLRILKQLSKVGLKWKVLTSLEIPIQIILAQDRQEEE